MDGWSGLQGWMRFTLNSPMLWMLTSFCSFAQRSGSSAGFIERWPPACGEFTAPNGRVQECQALVCECSKSREGAVTICCGKERAEPENGAMWWLKEWNELVWILRETLIVTPPHPKCPDGGFMYTSWTNISCPVGRRPQGRCRNTSEGLSISAVHRAAADRRC